MSDLPGPGPWNQHRWQRSRRTWRLAALNLMTKASQPVSESESLWVEVPGCCNYLCGHSPPHHGLVKADRLFPEEQWMQGPRTLSPESLFFRKVLTVWQRLGGLSWPWEAGSPGPGFSSAL